jgi:hypothetical protein
MPRTWIGAQGPSKKSSNGHEGGGAVREGHFNIRQPQPGVEVEETTCLPVSPEGQRRQIEFLKFAFWGCVMSRRRS